MIARKSALIIATNTFDGILGYVALFFITRYMSPDEYGIVAFALGFVTLFAVLGQLGYSNAHVKKISEGKDFGTCNGTFITIRIGLIGLMLSVTIAAIIFWKVIMGQGFETKTHEIAIYIMMIYWVFRLLAGAFSSTFSARKEIAKSQVSIFLETSVRAIATVYVALAGFGAIALALTYVAGEIMSLLSTLYFSRKYPIKKPSFELFKDYSKFAFPLILVEVCSDLMTNIDKILIQLFWSSADVGYYFAAFRLTKFINVFAAALVMLLFPTFSALHSKKNIDGIKALVFQSERYLSMIAFPMTFGMIIFAEPAAKILLSGWVPATPILQVLPFFVLFAVLESPYQSQFLGMNRPHILRNRIIIMVCFNLVLNIILIPKDIQSLGITLFGLGARGAAIATVISYSIGLTYSRFMSWKLSGIKGNPRILIHAIAAFIMAGLMHVILHGLNMIIYITRWYHLIGFAALGLGIYLLIILLLGEFKKEDFYLFIDTINIKKMLRYIKKEIKE